MYHYQGCGLPYVFLQNGFELVDTPYGQGVSIHDIDGLHSALAEAIVNNPGQMLGCEVRFLRTQLELSQLALADVLGVSEQSVARWEKGKSKQVNAAAERLLRILYKESMADGRELSSLLKMLREIESTPAAPRRFIAKERKASWSARAESLQS